MPLPDVADTYRVTMHQTSQGEEILNVFYYRDTVPIAPTAISVAQNFWDKLKAAWRGVPTTTQSYTFDWVLAEQLFPPYNFAVYNVPLAEQTPTRVLAAEPMPTYVAGLIRLTVGNRSTRLGTKRISGLTEGDVVGNNLNNATITLLQTLGALMDDPINTDQGANSATPVVVGYPGQRRGNVVVVNDIIGNSVDGRVSHQVSRDPRRR